MTLTGIPFTSLFEDRLAFAREFLQYTLAEARYCSACEIAGSESTCWSCGGITSLTPPEGWHAATATTSERFTAKLRSAIGMRTRGPDALSAGDGR